MDAALGETDSTKLPALYSGMDRTGAYHHGLAFGKALMDEQIKYRHGIFDSSTHRYAFSNGHPYGLHTLMFIPTLKLQASPEQLDYWLPLAESGKIIGAYCQTELGHGMSE